MAIKLKIPKPKAPGKGGSGILPRDPVIRASLVAFLTLAIAIVSVFSYFYVKYARVIEKRFSSPVFSNSARIYAIPKTIRPGETVDVRAIAADLRHAGYADHDGGSPLGSYRVLKDGIEITPGPESYHSPDPARIVVTGAKVTEITTAKRRKAWKCVSSRAGMAVMLCVRAQLRRREGLPED